MRDDRTIERQKAFMQQVLGAVDRENILYLAEELGQVADGSTVAEATVALVIVLAEVIHNNGLTESRHELADGICGMIHTLLEAKDSMEPTNDNETAMH